MEMVQMKITMKNAIEAVADGLHNGMTKVVEVWQ